MEKAYNEYIDDLSDPIKNDEDKVYELIDRSKKSDKEPKDKTEITKYGPVYDFTTRSDADTTRINNELKRSGKFTRDEIRDATLQYSPDSHGHVDDYIKGVLASKPLGGDPAVPKRPEPFSSPKHVKNRMRGMEDELMQRSMGKNDEPLANDTYDPHDVQADDEMDEEMWEAKYNKWYPPKEYENVEKAWNSFKKGLVERAIKNSTPKKEVPGKIYNAEDPKDAEEFVNRVKKKDQLNWEDEREIRLTNDDDDDDYGNSDYENAMKDRYEDYLDSQTP